MANRPSAPHWCRTHGYWTSTASKGPQEFTSPQLPHPWRWPHTLRGPHGFQGSEFGTLRGHSLFHPWDGGVPRPEGIISGSFLFFEASRGLCSSWDTFPGLLGKEKAAPSQGALQLPRVLIYLIHQIEREKKRGNVQDWKGKFLSFLWTQTGTNQVAESWSFTPPPTCTDTIIKLFSKPMHLDNMILLFLKKKKKQERNLLLHWWWGQVRGSSILTSDSNTLLQ